MEPCLRAEATGWIQTLSIVPHSHASTDHDPVVRRGTETHLEPS